jgi:hypothetical protein
MPPNLRGTLLSLGVGESANRFDEFIRLIGGSVENISTFRQAENFAKDLEDCTIGEIQETLGVLLEEASGPVLAAWPSEGVAARIPARSLVGAIGDLWYPSMDDLVVVWSSASRFVIVVLDHEERITRSVISAQSG